MKQPLSTKDKVVSSLPFLATIALSNILIYLSEKTINKIWE